MSINIKTKQEPKPKSEALLDEDGFQIVVKGKKNKVLKVNQKIEQTITTNDNKKNKEIRDKYFEKQNQWLSNYQESNNKKENNNNENENDDDSTTTVKSSRRSRKKNNKLIIEELTPEQQLNKLYNSLIESENKMKETKFFKDIIKSQLEYKFLDINNGGGSGDSNEIFSNINEIVCYGIGDFSSSKKCLDQLAYITSIKSIYKNIKSIHIFDPVMNELEKQLVVEKLGFKLIEINEEGKRKCGNDDHGSLTLFYMPFCGRKLYDNVLWANWNNLNKIIIIGNSFNMYIDSINKVEDDYLQFSYTTKTNGIHDELLFPNNYPTQFIFHDLAIHIFPNSLLSKKDISFYSIENNLEPPKLVFGPE